MKLDSATVKGKKYTILDHNLNGFIGICKDDYSFLVEAYPGVSEEREFLFDNMDEAKAKWEEIKNSTALQKDISEGTFIYAVNGYDIIEGSKEYIVNNELFTKEGDKLIPWMFPICHHILAEDIEYYKELVERREGYREQIDKLNTQLENVEQKMEDVIYRNPLVLENHLKGETIDS